MPVFRPEDEIQIRELLDGARAARSSCSSRHGPEETPLPGAGDLDFGAETQRIVEALAALSDSVTCRVEQEPDGFERLSGRRRPARGPRTSASATTGCRGATSSAR